MPDRAAIGKVASKSGKTRNVFRTGARGLRIGLSPARDGADRRSRPVTPSGVVAWRSGLGPSSSLHGVLWTGSAQRFSSSAFLLPDIRALAWRSLRAGRAVKRRDAFEGRFDSRDKRLFFAAVTGKAPRALLRHPWRRERTGSAASGGRSHF